jgi:uncharacterized Rossmann fold enzyme
MGGSRVEETTDLIDVITLAPNITSTDRLDSIYVVHVHGDPVTYGQSHTTCWVVLSRKL